MSTIPGRFLTIEGIEGVGKSTQVARLSAGLNERGIAHVVTREPGGTPLAERIREIVLDGARGESLPPTAELLLMFACRAQNVDQWILPALGQGQIVISDRFTDSTLVYQGVARGLGAELVYEVDRIACRGLVPDLTLVIDIDTETGLKRAHNRNRATQDVETRIDEQAVGFHRKVRDAYHHLAADEPRRVRLIDGGGDEATVAEDVWEVVKPIVESSK